MSRLLPALFLAFLAGPIAFAEESTAATPEAGPTSQPVRPFFDRRDRMTPPWRERLGTFNPNGASSSEPVTSEEKSEVEKFMTTHSPKRWEKLQGLRDDRKQENVLRLMRNQMRALERMKIEDPKVYELRLARLPIEDEIFSLGWRIKHGDSENVPKLRQELHEKVQQFVDNSIQEQKLRIDRMQDRLHKQQQDLASAEAELEKFSRRKDDVIEKGVADIENERPGALKELAGPMFGTHKNRDGGRDGASPAATEPSAGADEPAP